MLARWESSSGLDPGGDEMAQAKPAVIAATSATMETIQRRIVVLSWGAARCYQSPVMIALERQHGVPAGLYRDPHDVMARSAPSRTHRGCPGPGRHARRERARQRTARPGCRWARRVLEYEHRRDLAPGQPFGARRNPGGRRGRTDGRRNRVRRVWAPRPREEGAEGTQPQPAVRASARVSGSYDRGYQPGPGPAGGVAALAHGGRCLLYTSPSPRDGLLSRM